MNTEANGVAWRTWVIGTLFAVCMWLAGMVAASTTAEVRESRSKLEKQSEQISMLFREQASLRAEFQFIRNELSEIKDILRERR